MLTIQCYDAVIFTGLTVIYSLGHQEKGCYCDSKTKVGSCCTVDTSGAFCPGQCLCMETFQNYVFVNVNVCHNKTSVVQHSAVLPTVIMMTVAAAGFLGIIISMLLICHERSWSPERAACPSTPQPLVHMPPPMYVATGIPVPEETVQGV